ncbi:MAG TPA: PASTA domain-containing protein, partial [Candidatus Hydrogenedentes bacterium]|nr:PASTA domain-containing protein [Candidatus Hydrogenedentota bacterium]
MDHVSVRRKVFGLCVAVLFIMGAAAAQTPVPIATLKDLNKIGRATGYPLNGIYELTADIDASPTAGWNSGAGFEPIGTETTPFSGSFDGKGHVIRNLVIRRDAKHLGLFGKLSASARITDLGLEGGSVATAGGDLDTVYAGFLAGENAGGTITRCYATGGVNASARLDCRVGGLVGLNSGTVDECYATGSVTSSSSNSYSFSSSSSSYSGGLVGYGGTVTNCYATGSVTSSSNSSFSSSYSYSGGLVGYGSGNLTDSYATGAATAEVTSQISARSTSYAGGLVGIGDSSTGISRCGASGPATARAYNAYAGGLAGSYNASSRQIADAYALGAVRALGTNSHAGGLVGRLGAGTLARTYASGPIAEGVYTGGLVATNSGGTVTSAYWDTQTTGLQWSAGGEPRNTAQMQQQATFSSWDFSGVWAISEGYSYPYLRWQAGPETIVPDVSAYALEEAESILGASWLVRGSLTERCDMQLPAGTVISQEPPAGSRVLRGTAINLVVSSGLCSAEVPDLIGLSRVEAEDLLTSAGLLAGQITRECANVPVDQVIGQSPEPGSLAQAGEYVDLILSAGLPTVPEVTGLALAAARSAITAVPGLVIGSVSYTCSDTVPADTVLSQDPAANAAVSCGTPISLVVSSGPCAVTVPNVVNQTESTARSMITGAGLTVGTVTQQCSSTVAAGSVISQNPAAGASVQPGAAVSLVVSSGPCPVTVPNVVNQTETTARSLITGAGLTVGAVTQQCSSTVAAGRVISQNPAAGASVQPGASVSLVVSSGPCGVTVPNVAGWSLNDAQQRILESGLTVGTISYACSNTVSNNSVIYQSPSSGSVVDAGSSVSLVVSTGACPPGVTSVPNLVGLTETDARDALSAANLVVGTIVRSCGTSVPRNTVMSQHLSPGTQVSPGSAINLVISSGPCSVTVPSVTGMLRTEVEAAILASALTVGQITTRCDDQVAQNLVISQNPLAGAIVTPDTPVSLVVSIGSCTVTVPNVTGQLLTDAENGVLEAGLVLGSVNWVCSDTEPRGKVISQSLPANSVVERNTVITLTAVKGPCTVTVPDLTGLSESVARSQVAGASLTVGTVTARCHDTVPAGYVIAQTPSGGTAVPAESTVNLVVSTGPCAVPDLRGKTEGAARSAILAAGLAVGATTYQCSDTVPQGNVIAQSPAAGAIVLYGSVVTLTVSSGRCPVAVPDLRGQIRSTAEQMLRAAGLAVGTVSVACSNEVPIAAVIDQTPSAGTVVAPGTQVNFSVATGPCPVAVPQVIGLSLTDAEALITTSGLAVGAVTSVCSDSAAVGAVVSQSVPGGTQVMPGSAVNLVTASGPCAEPGVTVPNLIGRTQTNAQTSVTEAGLTLGSVIPQCSDTVAAGLVISQSPEPNSSVGSGTAVNLVVSSGPCAPPDDNGSGEENSAVNWGTQAPADRVIMSLLYDGFNGVDQDGD